MEVEAVLTSIYSQCWSICQ